MRDDVDRSGASAHAATYKLSPYDSFFWLLGRKEPFIIQRTLRLQGGLQKKLVEQALRLLQLQHPLLQRTVSKQRPFVVAPTRKPIPLFIHPRRCPDSFGKFARAALEKPMPLRAGDTILRVDWVRGKDAHEIILSIEHAFSDLRSLVGLAIDLLDFLDRLHDGQADIKLDVQPWYPEVTSLLPQHKPRALPPKLVVPFGDATPLAAKAPYRFNPSYQRILTREQTRTAVARARQNKCTVQGMLCAAMIHTLNAHAMEHNLGGESFCFTPSDMRPYLNAQMKGKELGNYVSGIFHPFRIGRQRAFWKLAAVISRQIKTTIASDQFTRDTEGLSTLYHDRMTSEQAVQIMKARECCGFVSNGGLASYRDRYRHFVLKQVCGGVASPIMSGRAHLFWLGVQTMRGRMHLELRDTGIGDERKKFAKFMRDFLAVLLH
ncbi:MAG: hypothetical protein ISP45_03625 [Reyranella sp.]|nr:hypothetical protein [Reyranella sp.]